VNRWRAWVAKEDSLSCDSEEERRKTRVRRRRALCSSEADVAMSTELEDIRMFTPYMEHNQS